MPLTATGFDRVYQMLQRESAIVLAPGREHLVEARLGPIARQRGLADVGALVDTLRALRRLLHPGGRGGLTTDETSWLGDAEPCRDRP